MIRNRVAKTARHSSPPQLFLFSTLFRPKTYKIYIFFSSIKSRAFKDQKEKRQRGWKEEKGRKLLSVSDKNTFFRERLADLNRKGCGSNTLTHRHKKKGFFLQRKSFYIRFFSFLQNRKFEKRLFEVASEVSSVRDEGNKIKKFFLL